MKIIKPHTLFCLLVLFSIQYNLSAQAKGTIKGKVFDESNNSGIKNINIYLAYTMIGTTSDSDGNFEIQNVPQGTYEIIFSHVNYKRNGFSFQVIGGKTTEFEIKLLPKIYELETVPVVSANVDEWKDNLEIFKERLIGTSTLAEDVELINPEIISFEENEAGNLTASTNKPLKIINNALGYEITYYLTYFEAAEFSTKYAGMPFFKELETKEESIKEEWVKKRKSAYLGSLRHFLTLMCVSYDSSLHYKAKIDSLESQLLFIETEAANKIIDKYHYFSKSNFLREYGFSILNKANTDSKYIRKLFYGFDIKEHLEQSKISNEINFIKINNLKVLYNFENPDRNYIPTDPNEKNNYPTSTVVFLADSVAVDKKGRYFDKFMIQTIGYWGFERLAETLPYEYELPKDLD